MARELTPEFARQTKLPLSPWKRQERVHSLISSNVGDNSVVLFFFDKVGIQLGAGTHEEQTIFAQGRLGFLGRKALVSVAEDMYKWDVAHVSVE